MVSIVRVTPAEFTFDYYIPKQVINRLQATLLEMSIQLRLRNLPV